MKLEYFVAALAATIVSALPMSNTDTSGVLTGNTDFTAPTTNSEPILIPGLEQVYRPLCRTVHLKWQVYVLNGGKYQNSFFMEIKYPQSPHHTYTAVLHTWNEKSTGETTACYLDGVWCVKFSDRDMNEKITIQYADLDLSHEKPLLRYATAEHSKETFEYTD
ncbi:hypothetical protein BGZ95_007016, partial [Linnemannia exigua]